LGISARSEDSAHNKMDQLRRQFKEEEAKMIMKRPDLKREDDMQNPE